MTGYLITSLVWATILLIMHHYQSKARKSLEYRYDRVELLYMELLEARQKALERESAILLKLDQFNLVQDQNDITHEGHIKDLEVKLSSTISKQEASDRMIKSMRFQIADWKKSYESTARSYEIANDSRIRRGEILSSIYDLIEEEMNKCS